MNRPLSNFKKPQPDFAKQAWDAAEKAGTIEKSEEKQLFHLSQKEALKCRFEMIDMDNRMAECVVHNQGFTHGVRLHPPHLWRLENGIVYHRDNQQSEWVRWSPIVKENLGRFKE